MFEATYTDIQGRNQGLETGEAVENCDLTAQNNAVLFIDFYIIETLYISVTIATNSDHAVEKLLW